MALKIGDLSFVVQDATLCAQLPDPYWCAKYNPKGDRGLFWSLSVQGKRRVVDGEAWEPCVYHETIRFAVRRWKEVVGQVVSWDAPLDERTGEPNGGFYVFEHGEISRAKLRFVSNDGPRFGVNWEGFCDIHWDEEYGEGVPFSVDADAVFTGVTVRGSGADDDRSIRQRLGLYLELDDLVQQPIRKGPHRYDDGTLIAQCAFEPKTR